MQGDPGPTDQELDAYRAAMQRGDHEEAERIRATWESLDAWVQRRVQRLIDAENDPVLQEQAARAVARARDSATQARKRRQERQKSRARARSRQVRAARTVELPTKCARCGARLPTPASTGRPKLYCSAACRKAAYEDRRAKRPGAVGVQLVEKLITEQVAHPPAECLVVAMRTQESRHDAIERLVALLEQTPVTELRPRYFEIQRYVTRLSNALDRAEARAHRYARDHPDRGSSTSE